MRSDDLRRLRVAVAGAGFMGAIHTDLAARDARAEIVGIADKVPATAARLAAQYGGAPFAKVEDLIDCQAPDLLVVATNPSTHMAVMASALARGVAVLVEKPVCLSAADLSVVTRLAANHGKPILCAENLLFAPRWRAAYRAAEELGEIRNARAVFRTAAPHAAWLHSPQEGGVLFDLASHAVAACLFALPGRRPSSVYAVGRQATYSGKSITAEAHIMIRLNGGATMQCDVSWLGTAPETCTLELFGAQGEVTCDMHAAQAVRVIRRDEAVEGQDPAAAGSAFSADWIEEGGYPQQMRAAIDAMLCIAPYPVGPALVRDVVMLLEAAEHSIMSGSVVEVADQS